MNKRSVDLKKLSQAVDDFGALQKAVDHLREEKHALETQVSLLKKTTGDFMTRQNDLNREVAAVDTCLGERKAELDDLTAEMTRHKAQWALFCQFMAMLFGSSAITESIEGLIALFQRSKTSGWLVSQDPAYLRSVFVRAVMGDFLKSYRCNSCGGPVYGQ